MKLSCQKAGGATSKGEINQHLHGHLAAAAGKPVSYGSFGNLFWRNLDEADPDGDEWFRLVASKGFDAELTALLDKVRSAQRILRQSTDAQLRMNWGSSDRSEVPADEAISAVIG